MLFLLDRLTRAEHVAGLDDGVLVGFGSTGFVGAITDAVAEVRVGAQAGNIAWFAAEGLGLVQHVGDACLL